MKKSLIGSLVESLIVALGIGAAWSVAFIWVAAMIGSAVQQRQGYELLYVTYAGEPVIVRMARGAGGIYQNQEVVSLSGTPVDANTQQLLYASYLANSRLEPAGREQWESRLAAVSDGRSPATYWYLVHDGSAAGRAYGVGYNSVTRRVVGYFGKGGFTDRQPPRDQWFEILGGLAGQSPDLMRVEPYGQPAKVMHFIAEGKLWAVDPVAQTIKSLADCPGSAVIGTAFVTSDVPVAPPPGMRGIQAMASYYAATQRLLLREVERLTVVDPTTGAKHTYPLPESLGRSLIAAFVLPDDGLLLLSMKNPGFGDDSELPTHEAIWLDRDGQITRRETIPIQQQSGGSPLMVAWLGVVSSPMPLAGLISAFLIPVGMHSNDQADSYAQAFVMTAGMFWPCLLALVAIGCVTATLAYRRQRRFGLPGAFAWAVFAFLLGIPGWIAYRFHRSWPVLEECPACQQPAPRDRDACTECGGEFPPPPLKGIEVFA